MINTSSPSSLGPLLRQWRERRRMSQLALALEAEISSRHLSFMETGRSHPSREMVLLLAEVLDVIWMIWLLVIARRMQDSEPGRLAHEGEGGPHAIHTSSR